jgi:C4-dicarboxylate-binding protein DctP
MKTLGALPQVMAFSEVYQALQTGVVDGTENPPSNMFTQKMHEVQKYATLTNHGYLGYVLIVNKIFWDGLPNDVRAQLQQAVEESTAYANDISQKENDAALEAMQKSGKTEFHVPTAQERQAWIDALKPVHKQMASRIGKDLLQSIYQTTGAVYDN